MINAFGIEFNLIFIQEKLQHKNAIIKSKNIKNIKNHISKEKTPCILQTTFFNSKKSIFKI